MDFRKEPRAYDAALPEPERPTSGRAPIDGPSAPVRSESSKHQQAAAGRPEAPSLASRRQMDRSAKTDSSRTPAPALSADDFAERAQSLVLAEVKAVRQMLRRLEAIERAAGTFGCPSVTRSALVQQLARLNATASLVFWELTVG